MPNWMQLLETLEPYVKVGGEVAGKIGAGRAAGRALENQATAGADRQALDRYTAQELAKVNAARIGEEATQDRADRYRDSGATRAKQAALGDLLANVQDTSVSGLPDYIPRIQFSGGLRPSALGANARAAGQTLSRDALAAMLSGADVPDLPDLRGIGQDAPEATPMAEAGPLDTILNIGGYAGQAAGVVDEVQGARQRQREAQAAKNRPPPLPGVAPINTAGLGNVAPPASPDLAGDYRVNTLQLLAELKAAEDAAAQTRRGK